MKKNTHGGQRENAGRQSNPAPETNKESIVKFRVDSETNQMLKKQKKSFICHKGMEIMLPYLGKWDGKKWQQWETPGTDMCRVVYNANSFATQMLEHRRDANGMEADEAWTEEEKSLHSLLSKQWDELRAHITFWESKIPE